MPAIKNNMIGRRGLVEELVKFLKSRVLKEETRIGRVLNPCILNLGHGIASKLVLL